MIRLLTHILSLTNIVYHLEIWYILAIVIQIFRV